MPRHKNENEIRERLEKILATEAIQTDKITFYPPSYIVSIMDSYGYTVTKQTVINYYYAHGVRNEKGLWVKQL